VWRNSAQTLAFTSVETSASDISLQVQAHVVWDIIETMSFERM
jgi:hypothetical protein